MAIGYFIRLGDKTTCGGTVLEGRPTFSMHSIPVAREGDVVTCGKDGKVYSIAGGIHHFMAGVRIAGTLDSFSTCLCRARLIHSLPSATYRSDRSVSPATGSPSPVIAAMPLAAAPLQAAPKPTTNSPLEEEEEEEELEDAGIVLRLGLFFDGTGNNQANSATTEGCYAVSLGMSQEAGEDIRQYCATYGFDGEGNTPDNSYGNEASNVARLHELYPDDAFLQLPSGAEEAYLKVYLEGIGTRSGLGDSIYSQGSGKGETGVVARVEQIPGQVLKQLRLFQDANPGRMIRRIEIDLFGFSRGAAAARHCANDLQPVGPVATGRVVLVGSWFHLAPSQ